MHPALAPSCAPAPAPHPRLFHRPHLPQPDQALTWYVPLGLGSWFRGESVERVVELDWWQSATHTAKGGAGGSAGRGAGSEVTVTMVPAQHWSMRCESVGDGGRVCGVGRATDAGSMLRTCVVSSYLRRRWHGVLQVVPALATEQSCLRALPARVRVAAGMDRCRSLWGGYVVTTNPKAAPASASADPSAPASAAAVSANVSVSESPSPAWPPGQQQPGQQQQQQAGGGKTLRFYFAGDTGYCPVFKEIGERFGGIDLAAIPIGAYEPR